MGGLPPNWAVKSLIVRTETRLVIVRVNAAAISPSSYHQDQSAT